MARVDVTAKPGCIYDGVPRPDGAVFSCELSDAKVLKLIGKVDYEEGAVAEDAPESSPKRGRYRRRDLQAEG